MIGLKGTLRRSQPEPSRAFDSRFAGPLRKKELDSSDWEFRRVILVLKSYAYLQTDERGFCMVMKFIESVLCLRTKWAFSVMSWGRTIEHNKEVGGVDSSLHLLWLGLDIVLDVMKREPGFEGDAKKVGLVALFEVDHYHLQPVGL
jgi:hypothetical protein